jgi:hypothetical protein
MLCTGSRFDSCCSSPIYMFINVCHGSRLAPKLWKGMLTSSRYVQSLVPQQVHTPCPVFSLRKPTIIKRYNIKYPLLFVVCTAYVFLLLKAMTKPSLPVRHREDMTKPSCISLQPTICYRMWWFVPWFRTGSKHGATQVTWSAAGTALDSELRSILKQAV